MENSNSNHNHSSCNESNHSSPREIECEAPVAAVVSEEIPPQPARVRLMVSYNGRIQPRQQDNCLAYVGGDNKLLAIDRSFRFPAFVAKLRALFGSDNFVAKYQLPGEDLDSLISVTNDEDLENMVAEYERICRLSNAKHAVRLRLFLFNVPACGKKETSSVPSTAVPSPGAMSPKKVDVDYLFGLDSDPDPVSKKPEAEIQEDGDGGDSNKNKNDESAVKSVQEIPPPPIQAQPPPPQTVFIPQPRFASFVGGDGKLYYAIPANAVPAAQTFFGNMPRMPAPNVYENFVMPQVGQLNEAAYGSRAVYYEGTAGTFQTVTSNVE